MNPISTKTFEQALDRLSDIIDSLDRDDVPIDEGFCLCQEGITLVRFCNSKLKEVRKILDTYGKQNN